MNKQGSVLAAIAILALAFGIWLSQSPSKNKFEAGLLFDDLQEFANQLDSVEITNAQGVLFRAQKIADHWLATVNSEQLVYPISQGKLAGFVETMMHIKLVEAKTSKPQNYSRLGLQPIDITDSMATLVTLKKNDVSWQVLVGNKVTIGEGHYILKLDDARSWRTDKTINLPIDKFTWLKHPILPYQEQDISSISRVDSLDWQIVRSASGDFELINMPKGQKLEYDSILNSIVGSLTSLEFEQLLDVDEISADEYFTQSLTVLTQLEVSTTQENIFQVIVSEIDDKHFVNFNSNGPSQYWQKWYYQVSTFSAQQLIKTLDDFLAQDTPVTNASIHNSHAVDEGDSPN
jgi:hypothetical protein